VVEREQPEIRYAASGAVSIAYAVISDGPVDLVYVHGFAGNLDSELESPFYRPFHERIASFSRFILFDRRGTGLSDRMREPPTLETRMDDLRAVLDAAGAERAVVVGTFEAASMCLLFAATYPERVLALVLYNPIAKGTWAPDYPWAEPPDVPLTSTSCAAPGARWSLRSPTRVRWRRRSRTIRLSSATLRASNGWRRARVLR
jgi:pimeloyl-ACP methyl ester carboxylesterase